MDQEATASWEGSSGLEAGPNCDSSTPPSRCSAPPRADAARTTSFNGDLSSWQVGQVKSMNGMFNDATSFNGGLSRWDVGQRGRGYEQHAPWRHLVQR